MSSCTFPGNSDMYGLGIRASFYIQWFSTILSTWLAPSETDGLYLSTAFFVSATFLALLIQAPSLRAVEIYIILLLTFGAYLALVPLYLFRLLTGCNGRWDPTRYSRVPASPVFGILNFGLLVAVCGFQVWFWARRVPRLEREFGCEEFGFFFSPVRLDGVVFVILNEVFYVLLMGFCAGILVLKLGMKTGLWKRDENESEPLSGNHILRLQLLHSLLNLLIATTITTATELTTHWNHITSVTNISSAGQTIPLILSIAMLVRVFYVFRRHFKNDGTNPFTTVPCPREPDDLDQFVRLSVPAPVVVVHHGRRSRRKGGEQFYFV